MGSAGKQRRAEIDLRHRRRKQIVVVASLVVALATAAVAAVNWPGRDKSGAATGLGRTTAPPWEPQPDGLIDRLASFKFPPVGDESFHAHVLLSVYRDGKQVPVPANIGFETGGAHSSLHTHTPDGVIHMEADDPYPYELSHVFRAWDVAFDRTRLGGDVAAGSKAVWIYVNGKPAPAGRVVLKDRDNIVVAYGEPGSFPSEPAADALPGA